MTYSLAELDYDSAALEPYYSAEMLELHHSKPELESAARARRMGARVRPAVPQPAADYVDAIWNVVNWSDIATRFERAREVTLT